MCSNLKNHPKKIIFHEEKLLNSISFFELFGLRGIFLWQKIELKWLKTLFKIVINPLLNGTSSKTRVWENTWVLGSTLVSGTQCITPLGSTSTGSFISSNVWNTRTNKAFKKWQRKFYYNVCLVLFFSSTASKHLLGFKKRMGKMPISILVNEKNFSWIEILQ